METQTAPVSNDLPAFRRWLIYIAVALMPLSANVEKWVGAKKSVYLSPLDVLLPLLALFFGYDLLRRRDRIRLPVPPLAIVLWVGLAWVSLVWSDGFPSKDAIAVWLRGLLNPVFFGLVGVWVFANLPLEAKEYRTLLLILGGSFSICVLIALRQYMGPQGIPFDPDNPTQELGGTTHMRLGGWYDLRGVFGAQAALLVPAAVAVLLLEKDTIVRAVAGALAALTLCLTLAAGGFVAAVGGVLAVLACAFGARPWQRSSVAVLAGLLVLTAVVLPRLPRQNPQVLQRGLALYADDDSGERKPTARLRRYQASLSALAAPVDGQKPDSRPRWILGAGIGKYQSTINAFYRDPYPKPARRTDEEAAYDMESDERFSFGFLETVTVELGIPGLLAVLLVFAGWISAAHGAWTLQSSANAANPDNSTAMLALAALGAGVGALLLSIFGNPVIRGVGGSFAFFLALAYCCWLWSRPKST